MWNKILWFALLLTSTQSLGAEQVTESDPTRPSAFKLVTEGQVPALGDDALVLEAIFVLPQSRSAIINGVSVREGDEVFDAVVKAIEPNKVTIVQRVDGNWSDTTLLLNQQDNIKKIVVDDDKNQ